nr:hypothetical protein [Tanacetum cinerariifolium]
MSTQQDINAFRAQRLANTHDPLAFMANTQTPFHPDQSSLITYLKHPQPNNNFVQQPSFNTNYMPQPMQNLKDSLDPTTAIDMTLALMDKAFTLNNTTLTNNNQRNSSNTSNMQIAKPVLFKKLQINIGMEMLFQHQLRVMVMVSMQQLQMAQEEEAGIQSTQEEFEFMAAADAYEETERVKRNCILENNLQQASTSGTQFDKAPVYDSDRSTEYTELLELIPELHQVPQIDSNVIFKVSSMELGEGTVAQHPANIEETRVLYDSLYNNLEIEVEKVISINRKLKETNADLTTELARYKNQEKRFEIIQEKYDKLERCYQKSVYQEQCLTKMINALQLSSGQPIQTMHMRSLTPDSFYHTEQKMALGYQNPFYLKHAQQKQQSLYNGKVLLEKHDTPSLHDSEETLELAQESRLKMKQLNKEIKPVNYTKINHLLGILVSQTAKSREKLYFSNTSKTANVSKSISIPNKEFSDDAKPSVVRKFLNEFLKEVAKFVRDFKSLAKEANKSLVKHKALEMEIERLLRAVNKLHDMIYKNAKLRAQLFDKVSEQKDTTRGISTNTMFAEKSILGKPPSSSRPKLYAITPLPKSTAFAMVGIFKTNPFKASRVDNFVHNKHVKASVRTKPITVSQPHVITKNDVNFKTNSFSPKDVKSTTKTRRPFPRNNPKNDKEPISRRFPNLAFSMTGGQNWFDTLLIPLLSEYKPKDKEDYRDNECDT